MPIGDIYQVKLVSYDTDQLGLMIRHYVITGAVTPEPNLAFIANAFQGQFQPLVIPLLNNNATFRGCTVQKLLPAPPSLETQSTGAAGAGTAGTISAPRQCAGVIKLATNNPGRAGRGRMYAPFPATASVQADGAVGPAYQTNLQALANAVLTGLTVTSGGGSLSFTPCILHRKTSTVTTIVAVIARTKWGTQRRRGSFGRVNVMPF